MILKKYDLNWPEFPFYGFYRGRPLEINSIWGSDRLEAIALDIIELDHFEEQFFPISGRPYIDEFNVVNINLRKKVNNFMETFDWNMERKCYPGHVFSCTFLKVHLDGKVEYRKTEGMKPFWKIN